MGSGRDSLITDSQSREYTTSHPLIASNIDETRLDAQSFRKRDHDPNVDQEISRAYGSTLHDCSNWMKPDGAQYPPSHQNNQDLRFEWMSYSTDDVTVASSDDHGSGEGSAHYSDASSQSVHYQRSLPETFDFTGEEDLSSPSISTGYALNSATNYSDGTWVNQTPHNHLDYSTQAQSYPTQERSRQDQAGFPPRGGYMKSRKRSGTYRPLENSYMVLMTQPALTAGVYPLGSATSPRGISGSIDYPARLNPVHFTNEYSSTYNHHTAPLVHHSAKSPIASGHLPDETYTKPNHNRSTSVASSLNHAVDLAGQRALTQSSPVLEPRHISRLHKSLPPHLKNYLDKFRPSDNCHLVIREIAAELSIDAKKIDECNDKRLTKLLSTLCEQKLYVVQVDGPRKGVTAARCAFGTCTKPFGKNNRIRNLMHHLIHSHFQLEPFICADTACDSTFPWADDRARHEKVLHGYVHTP
ncbi:hypothetical protein M408DRAFT_328280 [Serendipita vermifera MAFF 305830]|uniref:C2H2-type domain-containing protein n=1 Tax=Serendipita vermifera MAFF 305830 TaxID=933852 RepID=A0A0C3BDM0_SERVB|nr:hypothetical protein M408DRAFT_328280 [Serendipita vermifera MAFF 305830]